MKKIIFIIFLCVFAGVTKSYAESANYEISETQNSYQSLSMGGRGGSITMSAYMFPVDGFMGNYGHCDLEVLGVSSGQITGSYCSMHFGSGEANYQTLTINPDSDILVLWIGSYYVEGGVYFNW